MSVALVTGGGRGLGRSIAEGLVAQGWDVAVTGRDPGSLVGVGALQVAGDVTDRAHVADAVARTTESLGPLDLLVANAGAFAVGGPLWESDPDAWWRDLEVNLRGVQLPLWAVLPGMVARGAGRVVALGSGFGNRPSHYGSAYGVAKTAVHRLVESVDGELVGTGVRAFAVSPGRARTDMTLGFPKGFTDGQPEYLLPPAEGWAPHEAVVALVLSIATGERDAFRGRLLRAIGPLPAPPTDGDQGTLRLVPYE